MKILTVVGARPQFIKAAAVRRAIESHNKGSKVKIREVLLHTGQHYDYMMNKVFFQELSLPEPDHHLGVGSETHARQTALMLERIEEVLIREKPEVILVYGDTNSTLAGALAAAKLCIPVAHVEAGLRSYNRSMPEETNRIITDHLSSFLFCPTLQAVRNLRKEGIRDSDTTAVKMVGDVMYDSLLHYLGIASNRSNILYSLGLKRGDSQTAGSDSNYLLVTIHRAENTDNRERLTSIISAIDYAAKRKTVVLPLHPRTRKMMKTYGLGIASKNVRAIEPVSYLDMLCLAKNATMILTDSGGLQKEAYWLGVPCITLRDETEWTETANSGWNILVGCEKGRILEGIEYWENNRPPTRKRTEFGDGKAAHRIIRFLLNAYGKKD